MAKTVLDIDGKNAFNKNDTICKGYTYIDIIKNFAVPAIPLLF